MLSSSSANQKPDFDSLWNYNKPAETEAKFRQLLPMAEESGDPAYLAELKTQIARTLGLQQKFDQAHTLLDSVYGTKRVGELKSGLRRSQSN